MTSPSRNRDDPARRAGFAAPQWDYSRLENAEPIEIIRWVVRSIERPAVATSFQSSGLVILHQIRALDPGIPVLFLDTGFHFPETLEFRDRIAKQWNLNLVNLRGVHGSPEGQAELYGRDLYRRDPNQCCMINKVEPLQRELEGYDGWISGLRRDQSPLRAQTPIVEAQLLPSNNEILKIHPLANWSRDDVDSYIAEHAIPTHPLLEQGYASVGCRPCTAPLPHERNERAGRWVGFDKAECGIHSFGKAGGARETEAEQ
ncbi:MAG: phosphoadenylyl-sulfate reductase [Actinomycetota bacterium]|nr:phosphoadenylyl-sulfate reductase [Actinomycetota bacterium]